MRNHDEKTKNMQRSVLPSARRKAAREERRAIHKRARARERDVLAEYSKNPSAPERDFRENRRKAATHWMKWDRRSADKIGPLTRWAVRTVENDPELRDAGLREQLAYFEALLPTDLIGRHAVSHIKWALVAEFHPEAAYYSWGHRPGPTREERRVQVLADARRILENGRHRELNIALRRAYADPPPVRVWSRRAMPPPEIRLLRGLHDVEDFADEVSEYAWACEVVARVAGR